MKKTAIYLLSLIVIGIVCFSVLLPAVRIISSGIEGFSAGFEAGQNGEELKGLPIHVDFEPTTSTLIQPKDSIVFENGKKLPIVIEKVSVMLPTEKVSSVWFWVSTITYPLEIILLIPLIWKFLRFIINISKEKIFDRSNVRLLRQFSKILIIIALLEIISGVCNEIFFNTLSFSLQGYELNPFWTFPWSNLLLGCLGMLMAEIWARGLEIEEEQKLTI